MYASETMLHNTEKLRKKSILFVLYNSRRCISLATNHRLTLSNLSYCLYRKSETKNKESFNKEVFLFFTFVERYRL
jgi:hypothetical protein